MKDLLEGPVGFFLGLALMGLVIGTTVVACTRAAYGHEEMARLGYVQTVVPGRADLVWRKAN